MSNSSDFNAGQLPEVNRLIHEPARYQIMALLSVVERVEFLFVLNHTHLTPGNLSAHVKKLEAARYLLVKKKFIRKVPRTFLEITERGKSAFEEYRRAMAEMLTRPVEIRSRLSKESDG